MTLQATLIILGVVALALVFVISFWKDRVGGIFSRKRRLPVLAEHRSYGLTPSRDFFLDAVPHNEETEPSLDALPDDLEGLNESSPNPHIDVNLKTPKGKTDPAFEHTLFPNPKKKRIWKNFGGKGSVEPKQSEIFADIPIVKNKIEAQDSLPNEVTLPDSSVAASLNTTRPVEDLAQLEPSSLKQLDYWVRIYGDEPVSRDLVLSVYKQQEYLLEHAHSLHGRLLSSRKWRSLDEEIESAEFTDIILTLQLSDRTGPVTESELTKFTNLVFSLSEALDRKFNFQCSVEDAQAQAERLEQFSKQYDLLAIINICGEGDRLFSGAAVVRAVEGAGMHYGDMQVFHGPDGDDGKPLFTLANMVKPGMFELDKMGDFTTPGLTLFMNVPKCPQPGEVFSKMSTVAQKISTILGGVLKDQKHQSLDEKVIKGIKRQVEEIGDEMSELGIEPGSEEALRLF
ncbi:MAG: cell division protein ZipA [Parasphingorhabdus sp.]|jgi:cell division protein ZipA